MRALAARLRAGQSMQGDAVQQIDSAVYRDPLRFVAERDRLFHAGPVPLAPSAWLAPGSLWAHDSLGRPLLLARGQDGALHLMDNVCRHRGTRLIEAGPPQPMARILCPYHAWAYGLDGRLLAVPRAESFPGLDRSDFALTGYPAADAGGLIWADLSGALLPPDAGLGSIAEDFAALGLAGKQVYRHNRHRVAANWKLIIDAFSESYHVARLHRATIADFFADSVATTQTEGRHFRNAVGRADHLAAIDDADLAALRSVVTFSYTLFPCAVVILSPDYVNILVLTPQGPADTLVDDYMLIPALPTTPEAAAHWDRSFALLDGGVFGAEDFAAAARCQAGIDSGRLPAVTLGTLETGVRWFHDQVEAALAELG